jgi:hypothetical protein
MSAARLTNSTTDQNPSNVLALLRAWCTSTQGEPVFELHDGRGEDMELCSAEHGGL